MKADLALPNALEPSSSDRLLIIPVAVLALTLNFYLGAFDLLIERLPRVVDGALLPALLIVALVITLTNGPLPARIDLVVVAVVVWQVMSLAWMFDPVTSLFLVRTEVLALALVTMVAGTFDARHLRQTLVTAAAMAIIGSTVAVAVWPTARSLALRDQSVGAEVNNAWRGLFPHKNSMGIFVAMYFVTAVTLARGRLRLFLAGAALVLLAGAQSVTALLTLLAGLGVYAWMLPSLLRRRPPHLALAALVVSAGVGSSLVLQNLSTLVGYFGKDPTLTGRTDIWSAAWWAIGDRPILGYGPAGFWLTEGELRDAIDRRIGFGVYQAHQGILELVLLFGVVGLILVAILFAVGVGAANKLGQRNEPVLGALGLAVLGMLVLASFSEPTLTGGGLMLAVFLVAAMGSAGRAVADPAGRPNPPGGA